MNKLRSALLALLTFGLTLSMGGCKIAVLDPKGIIAADEKQVMITAVCLMLLVVIPVILLNFFFAWRYRASNTKATYKPEWSHSTILEIICWTVPCIIIGVLGALTWITSHQLDPYKPLDSKVKPLIVQVVAMDWKWLFIYPAQNIATVNYLQLPVNVPVRFLITADAPMNAFQIPQLAGQIYAMPGMQTKLNIMASETGSYSGFSANISGDGFSGMKFIAKVTSQDEFNRWVKSVKKAPAKLTQKMYDQLAKPSENDPVQYFSFAQKDIYNGIIMKYMMPMNKSGANAAMSLSQ